MNQEKYEVFLQRTAYRYHQIDGGFIEHCDALFYGMEGSLHLELMLEVMTKEEYGE